jgi:hypothetical protein
LINAPDYSAAEDSTRLMLDVAKPWDYLVENLAGARTQASGRVIA